jgi:hypothetical protein
VYGREEAETPYEHKRMKLETSGVRVGMSSFYGEFDWLLPVRPAEIARLCTEKHLALQLSTVYYTVVDYMLLFDVLIFVHVWYSYSQKCWICCLDKRILVSSYILKIPSRGIT